MTPLQICHFEGADERIFRGDYDATIHHLVAEHLMGYVWKESPFANEEEYSADLRAKVLCHPSADWTPEAIIPDYAHSMDDALDVLIRMEELGWSLVLYHGSGSACCRLRYTPSGWWEGNHIDVRATGDFRRLPLAICRAAILICHHAPAPDLLHPISPANWTLRVREEWLTWVRNPNPVSHYGRR